MARFGRSFPATPIIKSNPGNRVIASITLSLSTKGHLTISGKTLSLNAAAALTKVTFAITQAWNNALYDSETGISWAVFSYSGGVVGTKFADGTSETTDASGVIEAATTAISHFIGDSVLVVFWKSAAGPLGEDIIGATFTTLVAGP